MPDFHIITSFVGLQSYEVTQWKRHHKSWIELWMQPRRKVYRCPICGKELTSYYNRRWTRLRDLNIAPHVVHVWVPPIWSIVLRVVLTRSP